MKCRIILLFLHPFISIYSGHYFKRARLLRAGFMAATSVREAIMLLFCTSGSRWAELRCHDNDVNVGVE